MYSFWVAQNGKGTRVTKQGNMQAKQCEKNDYEHLEDVSAGVGFNTMLTVVLSGFAHLNLPVVC